MNQHVIEYYINLASDLRYDFYTLALLVKREIRYSLYCSMVSVGVEPSPDYTEDIYPHDANPPMMFQYAQAA